MDIGLEVPSFSQVRSLFTCSNCQDKDIKHSRYDFLIEKKNRALNETTHLVARKIDNSVFSKRQDEAKV